MKKLVVVGMLVLTAVLLFSEVGVAQQAGQKLITVNTAWMPEHELFFAWYAKEKGFDKQEGLDLKLLSFDSGMAIAEALPAKQWVLGGTGGVPMVVTALRYNAYLIGIGNNESWTNALFVRPNSPVLKTKGAVKGYPDIYGTAADIKGKTFLVTTVSSAHFAMSSYLKAFGLKDSDVVVKQMDQASAVAAFESGIGDFACLWAPYTYTAVDKGWKEIANVDSSKAALPIVFVADKEYADKNPEVVAKFLRVMFRSINKLKEEGATPENIQLYQRMYKEFAGMEYTPDQAKKDIQSHPVYTLQDQLKMFDTAKGQSEVQRWEFLIADFLNANGRLKDAELAKVKSMNWVNGSYLKMVKTPVPSYK
jgi:NitT/TauT family transport system substrate-binding protein/sulfonate transport system substrate-binding protein